METDDGLTRRCQGKEGTLQFCIYFERNGTLVSPWDDIPYKPAARPPLPEQEQQQQPQQPQQPQQQQQQHQLQNHLYNYVVEIPRGTNAKLEIDNNDPPHHPIRQDTRRNQTSPTTRELRFVPDILGERGYPVNYGSIPQTWSSPDAETLTEIGEALIGDGAPIDLCDISSLPVTVGEVRTVEILGSLLLIDEEECDWKVIAIDVLDPEYPLFRGVGAWTDGVSLEARIDELKRPGHVQLIREWFQCYKVPEGKPRNRYGFGGNLIAAPSTSVIIEESHLQWKRRPSDYHTR